MDASPVAEAAARIKANIERVLVGKGGVIELTLAAVLSGGHLPFPDHADQGLDPQDSHLRLMPARYRTGRTVAEVARHKDLVARSRLTWLILGEQT